MVEWLDFASTLIWQLIVVGGLVAIDRHQLFCVLDDERTRSSERPIQWRMPHGEAEPIRARGFKAQTGLVDIGPRKRWLYSLHLYPEPEDLEDAVRALLEKP